jgi:hypothetical protein
MILARIARQVSMELIAAYTRARNVHDIPLLTRLRGCTGFTRGALWCAVRSTPEKQVEANACTSLSPAVSSPFPSALPTVGPTPRNPEPSWLLHHGVPS